MPKADVLYQVAALFVVAGMGIALIVSGGAAAVRPVRHRAPPAGSECFEVLMLFSLASIGARKISAPLVVVAWGRAASSAGLLAGRLRACDERIGEMPRSFRPGLVAISSPSWPVNITVLKGIQLQKPSTGSFLWKTWGPNKAMLGRRDARRCDTLVEGALTPRERGPMRLLARGRNAPYIQKSWFFPPTP